MTRPARLALAVSALLGSGCTLSGTASAPVYACAAQDAAGQRITCPAPRESYPGDGCQCVIRAAGGRGPDVFYGRIVTE